MGADRIRKFSILISVVFINSESTGAPAFQLGLVWWWLKLFKCSRINLLKQHNLPLDWGSWKTVIFSRTWFQKSDMGQKQTTAYQMKAQQTVFFQYSLSNWIWDSPSPSRVSNNKDGTFPGGLRKWKWRRDLDRHHTDFVAEVKQDTNNRFIDLNFAALASVSWELTAGKTYDFTDLSLLDLRSCVRYKRFIFDLKV